MQETDATTTTSRAREERRRRGEPQPRDVVVPRRVLLDVEVGLRDVRLGLVVVVVGDEVLDGVVREELPELVAELRRERLVVGDDERRPAGLLDRPRHRRRLAGAGRADERLELLARRGSRRRASRSPAAGRRSGCTWRSCRSSAIGDRVSPAVGRIALPLPDGRARRTQSLPYFTARRTQWLHRSRPCSAKSERFRQAPEPIEGVCDPRHDSS